MCEYENKIETFLFFYGAYVMLVTCFLGLRFGGNSFVLKFYLILDLSLNYYLLLLIVACDELWYLPIVLRISRNFGLIFYEGII